LPATNFTGLVSNNQTTAQSLLYFLSGSMASATQIYFIQSPNHENKWLSYFDKPRKINEPHQNEFSLFFKDDWKVRPSLTLNLGLRYEFYGVPYEGQGLSIIPKNGGGLGLFGVSGRSFDRWMRPNNGVDLSLLTDLEFVGPKTSQPDKSIYPNDWNNFGPAVGFAMGIAVVRQRKDQCARRLSGQFRGRRSRRSVEQLHFRDSRLHESCADCGPARRQLLQYGESARIGSDTTEFAADAAHSDSQTDRQRSGV
jgi:hypothetical protein